MTLCVTNKPKRQRRTSAANVPEPRKPALIGYARVSTDEQNLGLQQDALRAASCDCIFEDSGVSGTQWTRRGLDAALAALAPGDTLVVWRLDRLGRSLVQIVSLIEDLASSGIGFRSLTESFEASSPGGRLTLHLMAALAEFERTVIAERTRAGLAAARARGRRLGRPPRFDAKEREVALRSVQCGWSVKEAARQHGMHPRTLYRIIAAAPRGP